MIDDLERTDPAEALMREVGAQMRHVRLERGEDLEEVAEVLRIKPTYLYGIEQGDLSVMPGRTYALGFLRSYADHLGFDGEDLITQIKSTVDDLTDHTRLHLRTPLPEGRLPKTPLVLLSLAVVAGVYAGWSYLDRSGELVVETVAEVPDSLRRLAFDRQPEAGPPVELLPADGADDPVGPRPGVSGAARAPAGADTDDASAIAPGGALETGPALPPSESEAGTGEPGEAPAAASQGSATAPDDGARPGADDPEVADPPLAITPGAGPADDTDALADRTPTLRAAANLPAAALESDAPVPAAAPLEADDAAAAEVTWPPAAEVLARYDLDLASAPAESEVENPVVHEPQNLDSRVILRGLEASWVRIESEDGDYLRSRTLDEGDVFLVPTRDDLLLWTGNAGGLEVIVDGEVRPPLGTPGAVVKDVRLTPEALGASGTDSAP